MHDAEILRAAGLGVATGNSGENVGRLAGTVCERRGENGGAKTLPRLDFWKRQEPF